MIYYVSYKIIRFFLCVLVPRSGGRKYNNTKDDGLFFHPSILSSFSGLLEKPAAVPAAE